MVVYQTDMKELPESCGECTVFSCRLPEKKNTYKDEIKKKYLKVRHENCPLILIEDK